MAEYSNYNNVYSAEYIAKFSQYNGINDYDIKLEEDKQSFFGPIYSLGPIKLKTLKTYIKTNLANGFICLSKSLTGVPIFYDRKPNSSFGLYVDYQDLNNLTIKN